MLGLGFCLYFVSFRSNYETEHLQFSTELKVAFSHKVRLVSAYKDDHWRAGAAKGEKSFAFLDELYHFTQKIISVNDL